MKKMALLVLLCAVFSWWGGYEVSAAAYIKIQKVSEWGTTDYEIVKIHGEYAYCASIWGGVDIFDIRNPATPKQVAAYDPPSSLIWGLEIEGNYLFAATSVEVRIVDIANPKAPALVSIYTQSCIGLTKSGDYLYLLADDFTVQVVDVSNPYSPVRAGSLTGYHFSKALKAVGNYLYCITYDGDFLAVDVGDPWNPVVKGSLVNKSYSNICISGNYAYVSKNHGMAVIDISNPAAPQEKALYNSMDILGRNITVKDSYIYLGFFNYSYPSNIVGIEIIDISDPLTPVQATRIGPDIFTDWAETFDLDTGGNYLYAAGKGLRVFNIANPGSPAEVGSKTGTGYWNRAFTVSGNYAYISKDEKGIYTLDISNPASPKFISIYNIDAVQDMERSGQYLYAAGYNDGLVILDVSNPAAPQKVFELKKGYPVVNLDLKGQYLYILVQEYGLEIYDISTPASPKEVGYLELLKEENPVWDRITVVGNYAFCGYYTDYIDKFLVIDISNPAAPVKVSQGTGLGVFIKGNILLAPEIRREDIIYVYDISNPAAPREIAVHEMKHGTSIAFYGDYALLDALFFGFHVLDIANPAVLSVKGSYAGHWLRGLECSGDYIYGLADNKFLVYKASTASKAPRLVLDRTDLYFGVDASGVSSPSQKVGISNGGGANLHWEADASEDFIQARPYASSTANELYIGIDPTGLAPGKHKGTVTLRDYAASNSPRTINVTVTVYSGGQTKPPFGQFATPAYNTVAQGSIPVTGWVLDDIGVKSVKICREDGDTLASIGEAVFVEGARPDVAAEYPGYPANYSAGWGYMMLTNFLPEGDGTYALHAIATDMEGNQTDLGKRTITVSNGTATKPFGALDTPGQNGVTAGTAYTNFAWALTPQPKTIPFDGSTIQVYVDGQNMGKPVYNLSRSDIQSLFPGYNNTAGAGGYFHLDTTEFSNGIHTIQWVVKDDQGARDGIGSRYFKISNTDDTYTLPQSRGSSLAFELSAPDLERIPEDAAGSLTIKKGLEPDQGGNRVSPGLNGYYHVVIRELDNLEIGFAPGVRVSGGMAAGNKLVSLPLGSSFNKSGNVFYWHAGPGYYGEYRLIFFQEDESGNISRKNVKVTIIPK